MKRLLIVVFLAALLAALFLYRDYQNFLDTPLALPKQGLELAVTPGASIASVTAELKRQQVLQSDWYLRLYARLSKLASRIKAGEYVIAVGTTPKGLLDQLVAGRVIQYSLTIVEGWTFKQMLAAIHTHDKLQHTLQGLDDAQIMARLQQPKQHPEGRFFPDTYHFPAGTTDLAFLQRAMGAMEQRLQAIWQQRVPDLPLTNSYQALILASIIEKETGLANERVQIAGVFIRRLRKKMLLQTDPTVIYGLGKNFDGNLRRRDLRKDTAYNTYTRSGLPPTPIALPGAEAIAAAVNPADGDTLYFVARGDGGHVFSKTLKQHNRAVRQYQLKR